jgi:hypothetical protein
VDHEQVKVRVSDGDACPWCGEAGIPVLFGRPGLEASEAAMEGRIVLAGCLVRGDGSDAQWQCREHASHRWTSGDPESPLWLRAITRELAGRPHCERCGGSSTLLIYRDAAEIFAPDLAEGRATLTSEPAPAGVNAQHRCLTCGYTWS